MEILKSVEENKVTLSPVGWLDTQAAPMLEEALGEIDPETTEQLILDLAGTEYISSSGLRQVVAAYKKMGGRLLLRNVSENIMGILKATGIDKRLNIEK